MVTPYDPKIERLMKQYFIGPISMIYASECTYFLS